MTPGQGRAGRALPPDPAATSEAIADAHADQPRINAHFAQLAAIGGQHVAADLYFLDVEVERPVTIQLEVDAGLQRCADAVIFQTGAAVEQRDVGNARVVDAGAEIRADGRRGREMVLR